MTKGLNSPDAKRPRGGRSPLPDDADMPDKPQLRLSKERGALGRDSGGSGDRQSAPRAAPRAGTDTFRVVHRGLWPSN